MGWNRSVSLLVPIVMFGWVPLTVALFQWFPARKAVLISAIGGFLFLPANVAFIAPGVPDLGKIAFIAISLVVGKALSPTSSENVAKWGWYDLPMALWCFLVPVATSLSNGLGLYDGISGVLTNLLNWGVFYWAGRTYFSDSSTLRELCLGIAVAGLVYVPFIAFELRMAPTLSQRIYGFFAHSWSQHVRYGGYRPLVFMSHGLMVSQWMAVSSTVAFWLWRTRTVTHIGPIPAGLATMTLFVSTVLCKSANGWILLAAGVVAYGVYRWRAAPRALALAVLMLPAYMTVRLLDIIAIEDIQNVARIFVDEERVLSLTVRLLQERAFGDRALLRPLFGWGGYRRGWPIDPFTGREIVRAVDALWVIIFSTYGLLGLSSAFLPLWLAPWEAFRDVARSRSDSSSAQVSQVREEAAILGIGVVFYCVDALINAPTPAVYVLAAGALVGAHAAESRLIRRTQEIRKPFAPHSAKPRPRARASDLG